MTLSVRQLEMLKPFAAAVAFAQERVPMTSEEFAALDTAEQLRAFTMAGLARRRTVEEAYRLAIEATKNGWTKAQLGAELRRVAAEREGALLSRAHSELVFQNHHNTVTAHGRHAQLMAARELRPYWRYPLVPNDDRLSDICRPLLGFIARWDHPAWQHIFPPNHHGDRHKKVISLTEEQARALGIYEGDDQPYPFLDGQRILPDPGFDVAPRAGAIDDAFYRGRAGELGAEIAGKSAAAYELPALGDFAKGSLAKLPSRAVKLSDESTADDAWAALQKLLEVDDAAAMATLVDGIGDGVVVSRGSVASVLAAGERLESGMALSLLRAAVEDPTEIWLVARERGEETVFHKRYVAAFRRSKKGPLVAVVEESPDAWLMGARVFEDASEAEPLRTGRLIYSRGRTN